MEQTVPKNIFVQYNHVGCQRRDCADFCGSFPQNCARAHQEFLVCRDFLTPPTESSILPTVKLTFLKQLTGAPRLDEPDVEEITLRKFTMHVDGEVIEWYEDDEGNVYENHS